MYTPLNFVQKLCSPPPEFLKRFPTHVKSIHFLISDSGRYFRAFQGSVSIPAGLATAFHDRPFVLDGLDVAQHVLHRLRGHRRLRRQGRGRARKPGRHPVR